MNLHFAPMACSLATRIALYETGAPARFTLVDLKAKKLADGSSYLDVAPLGQVPALLTEAGDLITENTAVLQYVADRFPESKLAPPAGFERTRLQQWLGFISTELHKAVFIPLLDVQAPAAAKEWARTKIDLRFGYLQAHLARHDFLLDTFSIADAYLFTILNWSSAANVDLKQWPAVAAYRERLLKRPTIAKAVSEEWALYKEEHATRK